MLQWAARSKLTILVAGGSKLAFILLVLAHGTKYLNIAAAIDAVWVVAFCRYLAAVRSGLVAARA
jgi:hypothetical protein